MATVRTAADLEAAGAKRIYVRFGKLPVGASRNHRDGRLECGVSVYEAYLWDGRVVLDLRDVDQASARFVPAGAVKARLVYRVTGEVVGRGADGEPCLAVGCKARKIADPSEVDVYALVSDETIVVWC